MSKEEFIKSIYEELYGTEMPLDALLESILSEAYKIPIKLDSLEKDGNKWGVDAEKNSVGSSEVSLTGEDLEINLKPGGSISRSKDVFLPHFALSSDEMRRILAHIKLASGKEAVTLSIWPGYGIEGEGAFPARFMDALPAELQTALERGAGGIVYAINGVPLSDWLQRSVNVKEIGAGAGGGEEEGDDRIWGKSEVPEWLQKIRDIIGDAVRSGKVGVDVSYLPRFGGDRVFYTKEGDSVLLISPWKDRGAYILKKNMDLKGQPTDYDVAARKKMQEFIAKEKRKPKGIKPDADIPDEEIVAKKRAKLMFRDWLKETGNGYMMRRDFASRQADLKHLLDNGINYSDGLKLAESDEPDAEETSLFESKLNDRIRDSI